MKKTGRPSALLSIPAAAYNITALQKMIDFSLDVICSIDEQGNFLSVSAASTKVWGYAPEELAGKPYMDYVVEEDKALTQEAAAAIMAGVDMTHFQNRYNRKDGSVVSVVWSARWDFDERIMYCVAKDATEKKEAEKKARQYEEKLYRAYKLSNIGWWDWDVNNNHHSASDEVYLIYGLTRQAFPVITMELFLSMVHPKDTEKVQQQIALVHSMSTFEYVHRFIRPDGTIIYLLQSVQVEKNDRNEIIRVHGTTKDITKDRKAAIALKNSKENLLEILESIGDGFISMDRDWTVTYWNQQAEAMLGKKREDILGKRIWDEYGEALSLKFYTEYQRAMEENVPVHFEEFLPSLNMWFDVSAYPSKKGLTIYFKDVSERKQREEELHKLSLVAKQTVNAVVITDAEKKITWVNKAFTDISGYTLQEVLGKTPQFLQGPKTSPHTLAYLKDCIQAKIPFNCEILNYSKQGHEYWMEIKGQPIFNERGMVEQFFAIQTDITAKKEAETAIRLSEEKYKLLFHKSVRPMWIFDADTFRVVDVNEAALKQYGYSRAEFLQLTAPQIRVKEDQQEFFDAMRSRTKQKEATYHKLVRHVKKNGEILFVEVDFHSIELPSGRHFIAMVQDITEKIRLQQMVIEEKLMAQKEISKAIINTQEKERSEIGKELHDNVNQILTTAKLYVENIEYYPEKSNVFVVKSKDLLQKSINEIRFLAKQLVTPVINDLGFKATLDELIAHYQSLKLFEVDLHFKVDEETIEKEMQLTIYRIIQEQMNNVVKYARASRVEIMLHQKRNRLDVQVKDNGIGFNVSKNTNGLGMHNIKNRAEVFKGEVEVKAAVGKGCTLRLSFPCVSKVLLKKPFKERGLVDIEVLNSLARLAETAG
jgi:PAS domain S-box-containing protein